MAPPFGGGGLSGPMRFEFGRNWRRFLECVSEERIRAAERSLCALLDVELAGKRFLDAGCGSGLFSLAARRLGAEVHSFDVDAEACECTHELRRRLRPDDDAWSIEQGSVLDRDYLSSLGVFDVVYSWGVLHHTGDMWRALENVTGCVAEGGRLYVAIYNDQGWQSRAWRIAKRTYNLTPRALRWLEELPAAAVLIGPSVVKNTLRGRPLAGFGRRAGPRGMSPWHDLIDWLGGYPFEVARPEEVIRFCRVRGFELMDLVTCGGRMGCNEFVFRRTQ